MLVLGAGPAGCAAALTARRAGLSVTLVDRARFPRDKVCGDALSNKAVQLLRELGVGDALARAPQAEVRGAVALWPDGSPVLRRYDGAPGMLVERLVLDELLVRAAQRAGAQLLEETAVRGLHVEGGAVRGAWGPGLDWEARAVVAADGPGSVAWGPLGARKPQGRGLAVSATAYFEGVRGFAREGYSEHHFDASLPCGYGWVFPAVRGVSNVGVYLRADAYHAAGVGLRALLEGFLERLGERLGGARRVGPVRSWQLPLADVRAPVGMPGLLTAGDAGRHVDPLTGEGIWQALRSGADAGDALGRALAGGGSLDAAGVRRFAARMARELDAAAMARSAIQDAVRAVVDSGAYRNPLVRRAMQWGYGSGALEVSKRVG